MQIKCSLWEGLSILMWPVWRYLFFLLMRFKVFPLIHFWFTFVLLFTTILSKGWNRPARLTWTWWGSRTHGTTWSLCKYLGFFCFLKKSRTSDTIFSSLWFILNFFFLLNHIIDFSIWRFSSNWNLYDFYCIDMINVVWVIFFEI